MSVSEETGDKSGRRGHRSSARNARMGRHGRRMRRLPCNWISLRWPINVLESELFCGECGTGILHELIEEGPRSVGAHARDGVVDDGLLSRIRESCPCVRRTPRLAGSDSPRACPTTSRPSIWRNTAVSGLASPQRRRGRREAEGEGPGGSVLAVHRSIHKKQHSTGRQGKRRQWR